MTNEERLHKLWQEVDKASDALIIARDMMQGIWNHGGFAPPERKEEDGAIDAINRLAESCTVHLRRSPEAAMRFVVQFDGLYWMVYDTKSQYYPVQLHCLFPNAEKMAKDQCLFLNESPAMAA